MNLSEEQRDHAVLLTPEGRLDSNTSQAFEKRVMERIEGGDLRLVIDFSQLDYISSAGLRVLLMTAKRLKPAGGALALCGMRDHIREVFELSGFLPILTVVADTEAALTKVNG
ncbi:STAS domain-containing protein [Endothiovibrio diazotrophicus]